MGDVCVCVCVCVLWGVFVEVCTSKILLGFLLSISAPLRPLLLNSPINELN